MSTPVERRRRDRTEALWLALLPVLGKLTLAVIAAFFAMYVFVKLAHDVGEGDTRQFDVAVLQFLRAHRDPGVHTVMHWISWLGGPYAQPVIFFLCVLGLVAARRFWPDGLTLLVAGVGGAGLVSGLKRLFHRPRPEEIFDSLGYSFPSGHSFFALVLYCMLAYWLGRDATPRQRWWIWAAAVTGTLLMGFSRIYLGEHFPSDVAAGFAVAIPWVWGCLALPTALHRHGHDVSAEELRIRNRAILAQLREGAAFLPNLVKLAARLARDPRVPRSRKIGLVLLAAYLAMPLDLIPDFIPVLGTADDLVLVSLTLAWVLKAVPEGVVREHWDGETDLFALVDRVRGAVRDVWNRR